jgi:hypothetical protein
MGFVSSKGYKCVHGSEIGLCEGSDSIGVAAISLSWAQEENAMIVALIFSVLFLAGAIYNLSQGVYDEAVGGVCLSSVLGWLFLFNRLQEKKIEAFLLWLVAHKDELKNDRMKTLLWNGIPLQYDSLVTQYSFCTSFLVVSFKQSTGFLFEHSPNKLTANFISILVTFLFGWWGIPWGPVYTVQVIFRNLRGGTKTSIEALIDALEGAEQEVDASA